MAMKTAALLLAVVPAHQALAELSGEALLEQQISEVRAQVTAFRELVEQEYRHEQEDRRLQAVNWMTKATFNSLVSKYLSNVTDVETRLNDTAKALTMGDLELAGAMDSLWLLICGTLVMFMHAGFAMLETGCCRAKNASNVLMKNLVNVCVGSIAWYAFGWAFAYGDAANNGVIGYKEFAGDGFLTHDTGKYEAFNPKEPGQSKMLGWFFQWAFCTAAATIVSGGVAERVKAPTYAAYAFVMAGFIYPLVVAWTWGYGWLGSVADVGYMDFAGSGIVHLTGGASALAGTMVLGPRKGRFERPEEFEAHNLPLVVLGTLSLWFGWYGFNCGSTLSMNSASTGALGAQVAMNTTISAATAGITVFVLRYLITKRYDVGGLCNGILAGLVSITAPCGNVESFSALVIGLIGGVIYQGSSMLQVRLGIDDPVDASSVHGACGIWGVLAAGLFDWGSGFDHFHGWGGFSCTTGDDGACLTGVGGKAIGAQIVLILAVIVWSATLSAVTFYGLFKTGTLRVCEDTEEKGMDHKLHSPSKAYSFSTA